MKKTVFYQEAAYLLGMMILAIGTALMEAANFGMSMVVAPAYLLHLKLSPVFPVFSFGMAEYVLQGMLIIVLMLAMRRARLFYLFSFVTAVIYGFMLDASLAAMAHVPVAGLAMRMVSYAAGLVICSLGVALLFHTYIAPEAYELVVKEVSAKHGWPVSRVKTAYDCISCLIAVCMSFAFFGIGRFEGVKLGTILCALVNGTLIGRISAWLEAKFDFRDGLPMRRWFV